MFNLKSVEILKVVDLKDTHFSVHVGLLQLKVIIEDKDNGIKFLYPLGGSAFDQGFTPRSKGENILMIPVTNGYIPRNEAIAHRSEPAYYKNKGFSINDRGSQEIC